MPSDHAGASASPSGALTDIEAAVSSKVLSLAAVLEYKLTIGGEPGAKPARLYFQQRGVPCRAGNAMFAAADEAVAVIEKCTRQLRETADAATSALHEVEQQNRGLRDELRALRDGMAESREETRRQYERVRAAQDALLQTMQAGT